MYGRAIGSDDAPPLALQPLATALAFLLAPLLTGGFLTFKWPSLRKRMEQGLGVLAMVIFVLVIILVCLEHPEVFPRATYQTIVPALLYFPLAAGCSYVLATLCRVAPAIRRTITIETALQNLSLALAIGELVIGKDVENADQHRLDLLPFPLFYSLFMYWWMGLLIPLFRYQQRYNIQYGILDAPPDLLTNDDDDDNNDDKERTVDDDYHRDLEEQPTTTTKAHTSKKQKQDDKARRQRILTAELSLSSCGDDDDNSDRSAEKTEGGAKNDFEHTSTTN